MRHVIGWLLGWLVLFWLWLLLAGEWNRQELVAAAAAASVAATLGEVARTLGRVRARIRRRRLVRAWSVPHQVFADFGLLLWALALSVVRREVVRGRFVARPFPAGGHDPYAVGLRAWISVTATYSPNAYVVELDPERKLVLLHDLIPSRASEKPA